MNIRSLSILLVVILSLLNATITYSQASIDTLALQDFELSPSSPVWTYSGTPNGFLSGFSNASQSPQTSPFGINGSRAWHELSVSSGNTLTFDDQSIPIGYDSIRVRFRLAAFNTNGTSNGPDNLDYVLVSYSIDGGNSYTDRIRVRGATTNNSRWPYSATGLASVYYLPQLQEVFQPLGSGLRDSDGYSTVEIVFPGSITQLSLRITPRSSSSSDSWLIDDLVLTGENLQSPVVIAEVPTMGQWAKFIFSLALFTLGIVIVYNISRAFEVYS